MIWRRGSAGLAAAFWIGLPAAAPASVFLVAQAPLSSQNPTTPSPPVTQGLLPAQLLDQARADIAAHRYGQAQEALRSATLADNSQALSLLGWLHLDQRIAPRDAALMFRSFTLAAQAGDARAMTGLALAYRGGLGTAVNASATRQWLTQAQNAGDPNAFAFEGDVFFEAFGTPKDEAAAQALYEKAAKLGSAFGWRKR
jgi:TPR repeat protein